MRLVEVNLGVQCDEFAWYSFAGRPWAPSKPLLAAFSSKAEGMEAPESRTFLVLVDITGAQKAAMCISGVGDLAWLPDSCSLAVSAKENVLILNIGSRAVRSVARPGYGIAWSPDSTHLMCCGVSKTGQQSLDARADQLQEVASCSVQLGTAIGMAQIISGGNQRR